MRRLLFLVLAALPAFSVPQADDVSQIVRKGTAYVAGYEKEFSALAFSEDYDLKTTSKNHNGAKDDVVERHFASDIITVRDGSELFLVRGLYRGDGISAVNVEQALPSLRAVAPQGERVDVKGFRRSLNLPTIALGVLREKNVGRFTFRKTGQEMISGRTAFKIAFEERSTPDPRSPARAGSGALAGTLWIDASGKVWRSIIEVNRTMNASPSRARMTVRYEPNAEYGLLVPVSMQEHYEDLTFDIISDVEVIIDGNAIYSKFRSADGSAVRPSGGSSAAGPSDESPAAYKIVVDVPLVTLDVAVNGERGAVTDLNVEDFQVYENNKLQSIEHFSPATVPFNVLLLFDWSSSAERKRSFLQQAAAGFVDYLRPQDWLGIGRFASQLFMTGWTTHREMAVEGVASLSHPNAKIDHQINTTYLYSSLEAALVEELLPYSGRRRAMILLTDGQDSFHYRSVEPSATPEIIQQERLQFSRVMETVREMRIPIYVIAVNTDLNRELLPPGIDEVKAYGLRSQAEVDGYLKTVRQRLEQIAQVSGGRILFPKRFEDIVPVYREISQELGTFYTLGYRSNLDSSGTRRIVVKTKDSRLHVVQSRSSYEVP